MALQGSYYTTFRTNYRLSIEWEATQNISANTSRVTAKMYIASIASGYSINATSLNKSGMQYNDGEWNIVNVAPKVSANSKKLLQTYAFTINHEPDGTASFSLDGYFDVDANLSNVFVGRVDLDQKTFTLDTIPRSSIISSSLNMTAGEDFTVSLTKYLSTFNHQVDVTIGGVLIKTLAFSASESSKTTAFTSAEKNAIFTAMGSEVSKPVVLTVRTYDGTTLIGTSTKSGTATAPNNSFPTVGSFFYIGAGFTVNIVSPNSAYTHTVRLMNGSTVLKSVTGVNTSSIVFTTADIATALYNATPNSNSKAFTVEVLTYSGSSQIGGARGASIEGYVSTSNPLFNASNVTYRDTNEVTTRITGDSQYLIQDHSLLEVTIPVGSKATPVNGASMVSYEVTVNGVTQTAPFSATANVVLNFGKVTANSNISMVIKAVDSRGNGTESFRTLLVVPYTSPVVSSSTFRTNGIEAQTTIKASGSIAPLNIGGSNRNALTNVAGTTAPVQYRYKQNIASATFGAWTNITAGMSGMNFTGNDTILTLDSTKGFVFEIRATDKLATTVVEKTITSGKPIFAIDSEKGSVGVGKFPTGYNTFEVDGTFSTTQIMTNYLTVLGVPLFMGNAEAFRFEYTTHAFMSWIKDGTRQAQVGFPTSTSDFTIRNDKVGKELTVGTDLKFNTHKVFTGENFRIQQGVKNVMPATSNTIKSEVVTFSPAFPSAPIVQATNGGGAVEPVKISVTNVTATSCTINLLRTTSGGADVMWTATWIG